MKGPSDVEFLKFYWGAGELKSPTCCNYIFSWGSIYAVLHVIRNIMKHLNTYSYHFENNLEMKSREISAFILSDYLFALYDPCTSVPPSYHSQKSPFISFTTSQTSTYPPLSICGLMRGEVWFHPHCRNPRFTSLRTPWLKSIFGQITD